MHLLKTILSKLSDIFIDLEQHSRTRVNWIFQFHQDGQVVSEEDANGSVNS